MLDKKTFVFAVAVSWVLTLVTVLAFTNFVPSLGMSSNQQSVSFKSSQIVNLEKNEVVELDDWGGIWVKNLNFSYSPSNINDNAILEIVGFFEYRIDSSDERSVGLTTYLKINDVTFPAVTSQTYDSNGAWQLIPFKINPKDTSKWINPNQSNYPIQFSLNSHIKVTVRNLNLILLVVDE